MLVTLGEIRVTTVEEIQVNSVEERDGGGWWSDFLGPDSERGVHHCYPRSMVQFQSQVAQKSKESWTMSPAEHPPCRSNPMVWKERRNLWKLLVGSVFLLPLFDFKYFTH